MRDDALSSVKQEALRAAYWSAGDQSENLGVQAMRVAIAIIFLWIGAAKFVAYEADSITQFVANNPVIRLFWQTSGLPNS